MTDQTQPLKTRLQNVSTAPLSGINFDALPDSTGLVLLRHKNTWAHISETDNIRRRVRQHAGTGQTLSNSPLRKAVCEFLKLAAPEEIRSGQMDKRTRTLARIEAWISECEVGYLECDLADLADSKIEAIKFLKPKLNKI
jgi:hypothetical protein